MVNPGGDRILNCAIHELAVYLICYDEISKAYYKKKKSEGKTPREALRCLKRRLCDIIYAILKKNIPYKKPDNIIKIQPEKQSKTKLHKAISWFYLLTESSEKITKDVTSINTIEEFLEQVIKSAQGFGYKINVWKIK